MGSSCSSAKKSAAKGNKTSQKYQTNRNENEQKITQIDQPIRRISKEALEEYFKQRNSINANLQLQLNPKLEMQNSAKNQSSENIQKEISFQSTNVPNLLSHNVSTKFESPYNYKHQNKTPLNLARRKISQTEIFIRERKKNMQEKGIYNYTPYTILPAPKLKMLGHNALYKQRKSSLAHIPSEIFSNNVASQKTATRVNYTINNNNFGCSEGEFVMQRNNNTLLQMPQGDIDIVKTNI